MALVDDSDDWMNEILLRKGFHELDVGLRDGEIDRLWRILLDSLTVSVNRWNAHCRRYGASEEELHLYPDASAAHANQELEKLRLEHVKKQGLPPDPQMSREDAASDLSGAPIFSACVETKGKDFLGRPKARLWIWKTYRGSPINIVYTHNPNPNTGDESILDIDISAGQMVGDRQEWIQNAIRTLLRPLFGA